MELIAIEDANGQFKIAIDSNVFIALEEVGTASDQHSNEAAGFFSLATMLGARVVVTDATSKEILQAPGEKRRIRLEQLKKYVVLRPIPTPRDLAERAGFPVQRSVNDEMDLEILASLAVGAANWLVTQDASLRKRAKRAGYESIFSLAEVIETLKSYVYKPASTSDVDTLLGYQISLEAPIFNTLKNDYPEFCMWWREKVLHRDVVILGTTDNPEALAVLKIETDHPYGLQERVLKICTSITNEAFQGSRRGELLLKATIDYARLNSCKCVYVEVLPNKAWLLSWLTGFGFLRLQGATTVRDERVMAKNLAPPLDTKSLSPLEHNIAFGPGSLIVETVHIVPIKPHFASRLFPETEKQTPLFPRIDPCGNSIRKAYLCHAATRRVQPGDVLLFLRTGRNTAVTAVGVVEKCLISTIPEEIIAFVGNRTVYSASEIKELCQDGQTLSIRFRFDRALSPPWTKTWLHEAKVLSGTAQSIGQVREEGTNWVRHQLSASF